MLSTYNRFQDNLAKLIDRIRSWGGDDFAVHAIGHYGEKVISVWPATWAGKINQILRCDLQPERARWRSLTRSGWPAVSRKKPFPKSIIIKFFIDQTCLTKIAGYWPRSFFARFWTSTPSRSIKPRKKNLAKIQSSWKLVNNRDVLLSFSSSF